MHIYIYICVHVYICTSENSISARCARTVCSWLLACMFWCVCVMHIRRNMFIYTCIHVYVYIRALMRATICIYTRTHDSVTVHICTYAHTRTHTHTHIYIHPNIITYIYIPDERCGRRMEPFHHILWRACGVQAIRYFFCSPPSTSSSKCVYTY